MHNADRWFKARRISLLILLLSVFQACSDQSAVSGNEYLIRVGNRVVTMLDFEMAFEMAKSAYSHTTLRDQGIHDALQARVLREMTEDLIFLERADELNIVITDADVSKVVNDLKKDYPDDVFKETLLEHAVSYASWEAGIRMRMLKEKVIEKDIENQIQITQNEISEFYETYQKEFTETSGEPVAGQDLNEAMIRNLRRLKVERAYGEWMKNLEKKYSVEINRSLLLTKMRPNDN